ncbi:MAG: butyrate kinase [Planctomycetota bacterium]
MDDKGRFLVLCINPGSTSTKIGVFRDEEPVTVVNVPHKPEELKAFERVADQKSYRAQHVLETLKQSGIAVSELDAVVGRGGMMKPIPGGTYSVNSVMLEDLADYSLKYYGSEHIANLGAAIAKEIGDEAGAPSFIVDPISTDDFIPLTRISGVPEVERVSLMHSLNLRAKGRQAASLQGGKFEELNMVGCHLGGGISMAAFEKGRAIDANHGLLGYGPFSPQRAGTLSISAVMDFCFSGKYSAKDLQKKFGKESGFIGYLGTDDGREVLRMIDEGDELARTVFDAMALQTAKEIAALAAVLSGDVACIFITGGLANAVRLVEAVTARVSFIAPVHVLPGEDELTAMNEGALRILRGQEKPHEYTASDSLKERVENPDKFKVINNLRRAGGK